MDKFNDESDLLPIRCGYCGRFYGFECLVNGVVFIRCKNCKQWITIIRGDIALTAENLSYKLEERTRGRKSHKTKRP